jgi:uncharacterized protein with HEPN domain
MSDLINKWLYDIIESITSIDDYIVEKKYFEAYEKNKQLRRSIEREIEIIGEAVNRIKKEDPDIQKKILIKLLQPETELFMLMMLLITLLSGELLSIIYRY